MITIVLLRSGDSYAITTVSARQYATTRCPHEADTLTVDAQLPEGVASGKDQPQGSDGDKAIRALYGARVAGVAVNKCERCASGDVAHSAREPLTYVGSEVRYPVERCGTPVTLSRYVDGVLSRRAVRVMCGGLAYDIESERVVWNGGAYREVTFGARGVHYGNALDKCPCCKQPFSDR